MPVFPRLRAWSLKTKLALGGGVLMFVLLVASTSWMLRTLQDDVRRSVTDAQQSLLQSTAIGIDEKVGERKRALAGIARVLSKYPLASAQAYDEFFESRPVLGELFESLLLVDPSGHVVYARPNRVVPVGLDVSDRDYVKRILAGEEVVVSAPFKGKTRGEPGIVFAAPVHADDGKVASVLVGGLSLNRPNFLGALAQIRIGREGYFAVVERDAEPLTVMHPQKDLILRPALEALGARQLTQAQSGAGGTVQNVDAGGRATLTGTWPLRAVPWVLTAVYPTDEAFAGLRARQRELLWVAALLLVVAAVAAWWMVDRLLRPLTQLQQVMAQHVVEPNASIPASIAGSAELVAVVDAYNKQTDARRQFESRVRASERRLADITDNLPVLISYLDKDERFLFLNSTFQHWVGIDPAQTIGRAAVDVLGPKRYGERRSQIRRCLGGARVTFETEVEFEGVPRNLHSIYVPDVQPDGSVAGLYALSTDVTALKQAERQLNLQVRSDTLTGLANRYQFNETLPLALARCQRGGHGLALMFLDIDHFKKINDSHGHAVGDGALKEFARRLLRSVRVTDLVARLAGDEFVVILEGLHGDAEPQKVATKMLAEIGQPFELDGRVLNVTASIGIACTGFSGDSATGAQLLARADVALYDAKAAGRNTFAVSLT